MAEINNLLSEKAKQESKDYLKFLKAANEEYAKLMTSYKKLSTETRKQTKNEKDLDEVTKQGNKLLNQRNTLIAKDDKRLQALTRTVVKQKEAQKEQNRIMREQAKIDLGIKKRNGLFKSMTKSILAAGVAMVGFRTVLNVFKNSLKTIATFEQAMSKVKAVAGALPREFKQLTANAKELGSTTSKTATEVAGLQLEFSKLGFSTTEILAATEATISLSIAAGSDLAESAVVAASTIRGFGLNASETQRVVDVMAKSFSSSALDLEKFKTSMAAVAPVAKANGKDIEFVTARLSVLSDAGLDASTSGTSLRNMFLNLSKQGLTWEEGLAKINNSTNKNVAALDLFGKRGATAALILADNIDKAQGLEKAYDGAAGSAAEMARIMEDNLIGDTNKLSSAWEGFILGLNKGEGSISNVFRGLVQWLTAVVKMFNMANKSYEELVETAKDDQLGDFIKGDAEEVAFLTDKLGDYNRAVELVIASLEEYNKGWLTTEEHEVVEARIFALKSLIANTKTLTNEVDENTEAKNKNAKATKEQIESEEDFFDSATTLLKMEFDEKKKVNDLKKQQDADYQAWLDSLQAERDAKNQRALDKEVRDAEKLAEVKRQIREATETAIVDGGNAIFNLKQSQLKREIEAEEDGSKRQKQLMRELAVSERNQALFSVAISTAKGIAGALPNIPLSVIIAGIGALQAGAIAAQPLPAFFAGTDNAPSTFIAGDKYGRELIAKNDGSVELTPNSATIYSGNEYKGASIIPNSQTERILSGGGSSGDTRMLNELRLTRKAIENSAPNIRFSKNVGKLNVKHLRSKYGIN